MRLRVHHCIGLLSEGFADDDRFRPVGSVRDCASQMGPLDLQQDQHWYGRSWLGRRPNATQFCRFRPGYETIVFVFHTKRLDVSKASG